MNFWFIISYLLIHSFDKHKTLAQADNFNSASFNYLLFTREHQVQYTDGDLFDECFRPTHATKILIHGWTADINYGCVPLLTYCYLANSDCNVIGKNVLVFTLIFYLVIIPQLLIGQTLPTMMKLLKIFMQLERRLPI